MIAVRALSFNKKLPVFATGYDNGWIQIHRLLGVENGVILKNLQPDDFEELEEQRMKAVLEAGK